VDTAVVELAHEQHGMLARWQLLRAGLSPDTVDRWVKAGRLIRVHRGVYALGHVPPSPHAKAMAAVLACGPNAVLSHRSAAALWGLIRYYGATEVTAPSNHAHRRITVHRARLTDADITRHYAIPVTTPARTLTDLARSLDPATLTRALNDARLRRLMSLDDLPPKLRRGQPANPTRSAFEDAFRTFCDRHELPQPEINVVVAGYEVDALWRAQRLIAELDGEDYHQDFETDRAKDADLLEARYRVVRVTWDRLTRKPAREADRFRHLLA
jgi:very-short-patch-repair endonuclease